jgi:hypothetical protein
MGRGHATCTGRPQARNDRGSGFDPDLDDFKAQFREAWTRIRASLTDQDIADANGIAEISAEALISKPRLRFAVIAPWGRLDVLGSAVFRSDRTAAPQAAGYVARRRALHHEATEGRARRRRMAGGNGGA